MRLDNPFTPTFGKIPAILAGRDRIILEMKQAFTSNGGGRLLRRTGELQAAHLDQRAHAFWRKLGIPQTGIR